MMIYLYIFKYWEEFGDISR